MKKLMLILCMILVGMGAFAQRGNIELGGKLNCASSQPKVGVGVVARYQIDRNFRPELTLNYYPEDGHVSAWDLNVNLHYIFDITNRFKLYPLGGLGAFTYDNSWVVPDGSSSKLGLNLGGGLQFNITRELHLNAETYCQLVSDNGRGVMNVSLVYVF